MNQVVRKELPKQKNFKAQVYYPEQIGEDAPQYLKHYIYSKNKKESGGLFVYFRQLSMKEIVANEGASNDATVQFIFNFNPKINNELFVEFKNPISGQAETYAIVGQPDIYEGYRADIAVNCKLVIDSHEYSAEAYDNE